MEYSIEKYVASNNPKGVENILYELGAPKVTGGSDLLKKLDFATNKFREKAYIKLAEIDTPYRRLILSTIENKSNCSGCSGGCGKSNADGSEEIPNETKIKPVSQSLNTHIAVAGVVLLGILTIAVVVKK